MLSPITDDEFYSLKVSGISLRKCFIGNGLVSGILSAPAYICSGGSTLKYYWI